MNVRNRTHYVNNKQYYVSKAKSAKDEIKELVREAKNRPCSDCGEIYPYYVMDFDHRPGTQKKFTIGMSSKTMGKQQALEEIAKCDVVCSNCHRIRTFQRLGDEA